MKWTCTALAGLLLIAGIGSRWYWCYYNRSQSGNIGIARGLLHVTWQGEYYYDPPDQKWSVRRHEFPLKWWWSGDFRKPGKYISIPLWMPALLFAVPAAFMWRRDWIKRRRANTNRCAHCNYDRTGLPSDRACPECGKSGTPDKHG